MSHQNSTHIPLQCSPQGLGFRVISGLGGLKGLGFTVQLDNYRVEHVRDLSSRSPLLSRSRRRPLKTEELCIPGKSACIQ